MLSFVMILIFDRNCKKLYYDFGTASLWNGGQCHLPLGSFCLSRNCWFSVT